ncbi:hypothetical protein BC834DRAFT_103303 [Gloeopeniophorella convolvens]|nr:hypothetical protein BC834DRAFT_103303 [Gloeopeniophorella convolvens]
MACDGHAVYPAAARPPTPAPRPHGSTQLPRAGHASASLHAHTSATKIQRPTWDVQDARSICDTMPPQRECRVCSACDRESRCRCELGARYFTVRGAPSTPQPASPNCANVCGYSLHPAHVRPCNLWGCCQDDNPLQQATVDMHDFLTSFAKVFQGGVAVRRDADARRSTCMTRKVEVNSRQQFLHTFSDLRSGDHMPNRNSAKHKLSLPRRRDNKFTGLFLPSIHRDPGHYCLFAASVCIPCGTSRLQQGLQCISYLGSFGTVQGTPAPRPGTRRSGTGPGISNAADVCYSSGAARADISCAMDDCGITL